jgi:hypothetical protein
MGAALSGEQQPQEDEDDFVPNPANPVATFTVSGGVSGSFTAEIFLDRVPVTASNFVDLCQSKFYDGLHFHRVVRQPVSIFGPAGPDSASPTPRGFRLFTHADVSSIETLSAQLSADPRVYEPVRLPVLKGPARS